MTSDFRSDPSESPEGKGMARRAWDRYVETLRPVAEPVAEVIARKWTTEMVGFYVTWHIYGGFEGLEQRYGMHRATIWRKVAKFRRTFHAHPDEFRFPGITIDTKSFWEAAVADEKRKAL